MLTHHAVVLSDIDGCPNSCQYQKFQCKIVIMLGPTRAVSHTAPLTPTQRANVFARLMSFKILLAIRPSQGLVATVLAHRRHHLFSSRDDDVERFRNRLPG